jgi:hypothetical protein
MQRIPTAVTLSGIILAGLTVGAQAQTVTSLNGSYTVAFTETTATIGTGLYEYTYDATLVAPTNGAYVDSLTFDFANPNAIIPVTANSDSFTAVNQSGNSIVFAAVPADPTAGIPADPGLSAANPTASFTFDSTFAPSATATALAITPSGGSNAGPGPGIGNYFVGPAAAPEPGAWATLGLGAFGLLGLTARARRVAARL